MDLVQTVLIAIVEGITEFLPISSTGHMVITSALMHIDEDPFTKYFEVCIQLGAILSVLVLYFKRFIDFRHPSFYLKLLIAVIPSLVMGKLLNDFIDENLGKPFVIAIVMIAGGVLLLFIDRWFRTPTVYAMEEMDNKTAFRIGLFQCLAIIFPGLSRSAATIIGGMTQKVSKELAAEFSFFLAVPTMFAATGYKSIKYISEYGMFNNHQLLDLLIGNGIAFIVALLAIRFFITFVKEKGFRIFGIYRIALGLLVLVLISMGYIHS